MKTKILTIAALTALVASSCSKDEIIGSGADSQVNSSDYINFSTYATQNISKGIPVASNDAFIAIDDVSIDVLGYTESEGADVEYMDIELTYVNDTWTYSPAMLWPSTSMDFYALYAPVSSSALAATMDASGDLIASMGIENYTISSTLGNQEDLLYATVSGATKEDATVSLQLQHALTQINFIVGLANGYEGLKLNVKNVSIHNVLDQGTLTIEAGKDSGDDGNFCMWSDQAFASTRSYAVAPYSSLVFDHDDYDSVDESTSGTIAANDLYYDATNEVIYQHVNDTDESDESTGHELMLLPQTFDAWVPATDGAVEAGGGAYILVECDLYIETDDGDKVYYLGGADNTDSYIAAAIPLASNTDDEGGYPEWTAGRNITYTIIFGDADGTVTPDVDGDQTPDDEVGDDPDDTDDDDDPTPGGGGYHPEDGTQVLSHISFSVSVTDWTDIYGTITM